MRPLIIATLLASSLLASLSGSLRSQPVPAISSGEPAPAPCLANWQAGMPRCESGHPAPPAMVLIRGQLLSIEPGNMPH